MLRIDESNVQQLYFQNPSFGFLVVTLLAGRLMADLQRHERQVEIVFSDR